MPWIKGVVITGAICLSAPVLLTGGSDGPTLGTTTTSVAAGTAQACDDVGEGGRASVVFATDITCAEAREVIVMYVRSGRVEAGWEVLNPAGCELLVVRSEDREAIVRDGYEAGNGRPMIGATKVWDCES